MLIYDEQRMMELVQLVMMVPYSPAVCKLLLVVTSMSKTTTSWPLLNVSVFIGTLHSNC